MAFNILIVDDSSVIRSMIARTIGMAGVPVGELFEAANGVEGLTALNGNWIDLVFADINMPVMDGVVMIQKMSEDKVTCDIPVVVVSTEGSETKIEKLMKRGVKEFVRKPFTPEKLRKVMQSVLGEWEKRRIDVPEDTF